MFSHSPRNVFTNEPPSRSDYVLASSSSTTRRLMCKRCRRLSFNAILDRFCVLRTPPHYLYRNPPCSIFQDPGSSHCGSGWTSENLALYNAGTRPAWGFALILLCFVCFNGQVCQWLWLLRPRVFAGVLGLVDRLTFWGVSCSRLMSHRKEVGTRVCMNNGACVCYALLVAHRRTQRCSLSPTALS